MRAVPSDLDPGVVREIDARIAGLDVAVPWAIESGSRAWGFPSPDSDYDCRFIFVRPIDAYLGPWHPRDVIETPLDEIFDVNGWDLIKAVRLLLNGNAVIVEWLRSPIVYTGNEEFQRELLDLARVVANRPRIGRHYLHVGRNQWKPDTAEMSLKKIFYSVRPAAALRWMAEHPTDATPPMNLLQLLAETDVPGDVRAEVDELIALKSITREIGRGPIPPAIAWFVTAEFERADAAYEHKDGRIDARARAVASEYFRGAISKYGH